MPPHFSRSVARWLTSIATISIVTLGLRALAGPLYLWHNGLQISSPIPFESAFWFALLGLLFLKSCSETRGLSRIHEAPEAVPWVLLILTVVAVIAFFISNLRDPFLSDDYILVTRASLNRAEFLAALHTPGGDGSFRPLGFLYFGLAKHFADTLSWRCIFSASYFTPPTPL